MGSPAKVFRLSLASNPRNIVRVESFLHEVNDELHLDEMQFNKVMVSVTEAVNNAIIHGNKSDEAKSTNITCEVLPDWLVVTVSDQGAGFDPNAVRSPIEENNLLRESGRGIFLMKSLMDKVEFQINHSGSEVKLWLSISK